MSTWWAFWPAWNSAVAKPPNCAWKTLIGVVQAELGIVKSIADLRVLRGF
jgi:hypothetical protein